jgi:aminoglycoside phosphotransferase (APT) family kinase protein
VSRDPAVVGQALALGRSGRFQLWELPGRPRLVVKRGPAAAIAREAAALGRVAARGVAPALVAAGEGVLVAERAPGAPRGREALDPRGARALGRLVRRVHGIEQARSAGLEAWARPARSLAAYRAARAADAIAAASRRRRRMAERVVGGLAPLPPAPAGPPFRLLHGDLVLPNVVWGPAPRLVDWEFWRLGDPAEDLAYAIEVNDLGADLAGALIAGYADPAVAVRLEGWQALVALDAGLWYEAAGEREEAARLLRRAEVLTPTGPPRAGGRSGGGARR